MWSRVAVRRIGDASWNAPLRMSGAVALLAIPAVLFLEPEVAGLVVFFIITMWVNGPLGIFLPATYEPILMLFGILYPPVLVAIIGIAGTLYIEGINYFIYRRLLETPALSGARQSRLVSSTAKLFNVAPFWTVWLCSWSPLPYWVVRILAPLARYPVKRYLAATLLGRFPRLWFFAAVGGSLRLSTGATVAVTVAIAVVLAAIVTVRVSGAKRRSAALNPALAAQP
jgi:uncharacterized membrane protein YdjX (TVP38/TMEM64 family)